MNPIDRGVDASTADEFMGRLSPLHADWRDAPRDWMLRGVPDAAAYFAATQAAERLHRHQGGRCAFCGGGRGSGIECPGCGATTDADPGTMGLAVWALNWRHVREPWRRQGPVVADSVGPARPASP